MKWNLWNRLVTLAALCALTLLAGAHGVSTERQSESTLERDPGPAFSSTALPRGGLAHSGLG